jgi:RHS repeat-associated protein
VFHLPPAAEVTGTTWLVASLGGDAQDRLTQITEDAHTATPKITKQIYSGFDERIAEILPGAGSETDRTARYILDHSFGNAQVIEERLGGASSLTAHHTLMPFQNAQGIMRISEVRGGANASVPETPINPVWRRYVTDHQSTTRALLDVNSALTDQISFLPFGEVQSRTGTTATPFQYTGEQQAAAGMTYLRARFMDPRQGRFLGMDPYAGNLRSPLSLNKFNYVHGNPVMMTDPTGRFAATMVSSLSGMSVNLGRIGSAAVAGANLLDKLDTALAFAQATRQIYSAVSGFSPTQLADAMFDTKFLDALQDWPSAIAALGMGMGKVTTDLTSDPRKKDQVTQFLKQPKNNLIIYMPTPSSRTPYLPPGTQVEVGQVSLTKSVRKVLLEFGKGGGQGGRMIGLGHSNAARKHDQGLQWFRMDWHDKTGHNYDFFETANGREYHFHTKSQ